MPTHQVDLPIPHVICTMRLIYLTDIPRRGGFLLHRVITVFGKQEFKSIAAYCKRKKLSFYGLAKAAIREYILQHP